MTEDQDLLDLLARAREAFEKLTPAEQAHHRHLQRISFAAGNLALSRSDAPPTAIRAAVERAAGPCPCDDCVTGNRIADARQVLDAYPVLATLDQIEAATRIPRERLTRALDFAVDQGWLKRVSYRRGPEPEDVWEVTRGGHAERERRRR